MKKSKKKIFSVSFPRELVNEIDESCETGDYDCRNSWMKQAVEDKLELEASIDGSESQDQEPEPKTFDCRDGYLYHNDQLFGKCADYELHDGKVYDTGQYLGQINNTGKSSQVVEI